MERTKFLINFTNFYSNKNRVLRKDEENVNTICKGHASEFGADGKQAEADSAEW